jgi:acetyl esterase/lipase
MVHDASRRPDVMVYYCHGGGFSMGSSYFYLEFLLAWVSLLKDAGYANPALLALEYTLVPESTYPTQVQQALAGYKYVLSVVDEPGRVCVSGDSAGATLILSLLLCLDKYAGMRNKLPGVAIPISPWSVILSEKNQNTASDYHNAESLHLYGTQYIGPKASSFDPLVSPGCCKDVAWWRRASPTHGFFFVYGAEEVFAPDARDLITLLKSGGIHVESHEEEGWVHAWPVVKLFLCNEQSERLGGLRRMVQFVRNRVEPAKRR